MYFPIEELKNWFLENRRSLPWRENPSPYRVWVSEVMLQQTQVSVVIAYFEKWMQCFPTISALAQASLEDVIKMWEGLGYYSRARHLHEAAQMIVKNYQGALPSSSEELKKIKGLGPYTRGAIRNFAFKQKAAAVDGNVLRVLSRYFAVEEPIDMPRTVDYLWQKAEEILPNEEPWIITEGLIELGAMVCKKDPQCCLCPLRTQCKAFLQGKEKILPQKRKKQPITHLYRLVGIVVCNESILVKKGEKGKVMSDLYEFPYLTLSPGFFSDTEIETLFSEYLKRQVIYQKPLLEQKHGFTRYKAHLFPHLLEVKKQDKEEFWIPKAELPKLPFSSGHRRILETLS